MRLKYLIEEDFINYKKPSMFLGTISCNGKCCRELGIPLSICQNNELKNAPIIEVNDDTLISKYLNNYITQSIVFGGLEPFEQFNELYDFIKTLRVKYNCKDDVVIYTGYMEREIFHFINALKDFGNIIIKFGRFIPNQESHFDEVLGINLVSPNQYGKEIYCE